MVSRPFKEKSSKYNSNNNSDNSELIKSVCIPRIGPAFHRFERVLHSNNIKVYHSQLTPENLSDPVFTQRQNKRKPEATRTSYFI